MLYHGNYKDWVQQDLFNNVLNSTGEVGPGRELNEASKQQGDVWKDITNVGAQWSFHYEEIGTFPELPIPYQGTINWWFVKINPTCVFPIHRDTFKKDTVRRLWIPYQDYISGHIFIYNDIFIKDYKAGDIFEFDDPTALHGSANITTIPKVSLQVVIYE